MRWTTLIGMAIALLLWVSACSLVQTPQPVANSSSPASANLAEPPVSLVSAIKSALSVETTLPTSQIDLKSVEAVNWNDSCLGLAQTDEICLMMITPGYRMVFSTPTQDYEFHSDRQRTFRRAESISLRS